MVFSASSPADHYWWKSDSELKRKSTGPFKAKSSVLFCSPQHVGERLASLNKTGFQKASPFKKQKDMHSMFCLLKELSLLKTCFLQKVIRIKFSNWEFCLKILIILHQNFCLDLCKTIYLHSAKQASELAWCVPIIADVYYSSQLGWHFPITPGLSVPITVVLTCTCHCWVDVHLSQLGWCIPITVWLMYTHASLLLFFSICVFQVIQYTEKIKDLRMYTKSTGNFKDQSKWFIKR